jgi:farnesyl-diphosphate farnesyltransferase
VPPELQRLLRDTSRSFYLTVRVLPRAVRPQVGLAYLLARATDTIADTELIPVTERLAALDALRGRILGTRAEPLDFTRLAAAQLGKSSAAERLLLRRVDDAVTVLGRFSAEDQARIRAVLTTITGGQELDLRRFDHGHDGVPPVLSPPLVTDASGANLTALTTDAELDDYTYRVAGCVGEFWTQLTRAHLFPTAPLDEVQFLADGIRFGKGLQLVNILRDLPGDLRNGRCYLPAARLAEFGLEPGDLLEPANYPRLRPFYAELLDRAQSHLEAGWRYTNTIPRNQFRLRLACAWPVLLGVKTISKLCDSNILDARKRVKVTRPEVQRMLFGSLMRLPFRGAWERQFAAAS